MVSERTNGMTSIDPQTKYTEDLIKRFSIELRFEYVSEIINEERTLKEFKSLYIKHAFDALGSKLKELYVNQYDYVQLIKKQYKERYMER